MYAVIAVTAAGPVELECTVTTLGSVGTAADGKPP